MITDDWYEKLRCPRCGKSGMATMSQANGEKPKVIVVPDGFKAVKTANGSDFHCATCKTAAYP